MTVKIGTGTSAVDLSTLRVGGVEPSKIMVGTGTTAVQAWSAYTPVSVDVAIPKQTATTSSSYVLASVTIPGPPGEVRQCQIRTVVNWANRASGQLYRLAFFKGGVRAIAWESAVLGTGPYAQSLEVGYGQPPYLEPQSLTCGSVFEVRTWVAAPNAANRLVNASALTITEV